MTNATRSRLRKADRRDQLLDAAAQLLSERGAAAFTMDGLAIAAGVSKALPYAHFENADAVQAALYQREIVHLGNAVLEAMRPVPKGEARLEAAIKAYFDFVQARGSVLAVLTSNPAATTTGDDNLGRDFVGQLLTDNFSIDPAAARLHGDLILGVLNAATARWARGASRRTIERTVVQFVLAGVRAAST